MKKAQKANNRNRLLAFCAYTRQRSNLLYLSNIDLPRRIRRIVLFSNIIKFVNYI